MTPQLVADAFYNGELEAELRRVGMIDYRFKVDADREKCMDVLEEIRSQTLYPHSVCSDDCKKRGILNNIMIKI